MGRIAKKKAYLAKIRDKFSQDWKNLKLNKIEVSSPIGLLRL